MGADSGADSNAGGGSSRTSRGILGWIKALFVGGAANDRSATDGDLVTTAGLLLAVGFGGFFATFLWAAGRSGHFLTSFATGSLIIAATGLIGAIVGLLFGIPKNVVAASAPSTNTPLTDAAQKPGDSLRPALATNTNLQEISDWLTKIIVGVGLVEAKQIAVFFEKMSGKVAASLPHAKGDTDATLQPMLEAITSCMIIFGLALGFLSGFLLTRQFLSLAFARVEFAMRDEQRYRNKYEVVSEQKKRLDSLVADSSKNQGEVFKHLYEPRPQGFQSALSLLSKLFEVELNKKNPALWTYFACANGQAYYWGKNNDKLSEDDPRMQQYRLGALEGVRNALRDGPGWKPELQQCWDIYYPTKLGDGPGKGENDLEVFYTDPEFEALLGPKSPKPDDPATPADHPSPTARPAETPDTTPAADPQQTQRPPSEAPANSTPGDPPPEPRRTPDTPPGPGTDSPPG